MLKVIVEIHPYGNEDHKSTIHTLYIGNVGTNKDNVANYSIWENTDPRKREPRRLPDAEVRGHQRGMPHGLQNLVQKAYKAILEAKEDD